MKNDLRVSRFVPACFLAATSAGWFAFAPVASAHPGHAITDASAAHVLSSPDHLAVLLLFAGLMATGAQFIHRRLPRRLLQSGAVATVVSAAALWGMRL